METLPEPTITAHRRTYGGNNAFHNFGVYCYWHHRQTYVCILDRQD